MARVVLLVVLGGPHLVLADIGDHQGFALGEAPQVVDHVRGIQVAVIGQVLDIAHGAVALHLVDVRQPLGCGRAARHAASKSAAACLRRSPIRARSTLTFLLISDGSISKWIFLALGA